MGNEPKNLDNPPIEVMHSSMKRVGDSMYKSDCPFCEPGVLLMARDQETMNLLAEDRCISCGQAVVYMDLETVEAQEEAAKPKLTSEQYVEAAGSRCPFCESDDILADPTEEGFESREAWQEVSCNACGQVWVEVYTMTGYELKEV